MHTSIAVGDSSPIFTAGLLHVAADRSDLDFPVVAYDEQSLIAGLKQGSVNLVLSCFEPLAASARIARTVDLPVVAMSWAHRAADVLDALRSGVRGLVTKSADAEHLWEVVHAVRLGHMVYPHGWEQALLDLDAGRGGPSRRRNDANPLTQREAEIVHLMLTGLSARQIATRLGIALQTVKNHTHHILSKLGLASRAELHAWAADRGWGQIASTAPESTPHAV